MIYTTISLLAVSTTFSSLGFEYTTIVRHTANVDKLFDSATLKDDDDAFNN
jgi:hypothetical protein